MERTFKYNVHTIILRSIFLLIMELTAATPFQLSIEDEILDKNSLKPTFR